MNPFRDLIPVHFLSHKCFQHQQVKCTLQQISGLLRMLSHKVFRGV